MISWPSSADREVLFGRFLGDARQLRFLAAVGDLLRDLFEDALAVAREAEVHVRLPVAARAFVEALLRVRDVGARQDRVVLDDVEGVRVAVEHFARRRLRSGPRPGSATVPGLTRTAFGSRSGHLPLRISSCPVVRAPFRFPRRGRSSAFPRAARAEHRAGSFRRPGTSCRRGSRSPARACSLPVPGRVVVAQFRRAFQGALDGLVLGQPEGRAARFAPAGDRRVRWAPGSPSGPITFGSQS